MRVIEGGRGGFRARLNESLARFGLSQSAVARRVGVERSAVNAWARGRRTPDLDTARKLAALFHWSTAEMLSWFGVYEPQAHEVDKTRQKLDAATSPSGMIPAPAVTSPVTPSTQSSGDPQKELLAVPTPEHRALYVMLASFSVAELAPVAQLTTEIFLRHFGAGREDKVAEGE